jgi:hypothetical protein
VLCSRDISTAAKKENRSAGAHSLRTTDSKRELCPDTLTREGMRQSNRARLQIQTRNELRRRQRENKKIHKENPARNHKIAKLKNEDQ